ncbi:MAG TPA: thiosulfate oxidation carrier complex protein SoxZ [Methylomirabilota bacterium]
MSRPILVNRIVVSYLGRDVAEIEPSTTVSEKPTFAIPLRVSEAGPIRGTFFDTHGERFEGVAEVKVT